MTRLAQRVTLAVIVCFGLEGLANAAHAPLVRAETEANGTTATANPLPLLGGYGAGTGAIDVAGDLDFWSFVAPAGSKVWILCDTGGTQVGMPNSRDTVIELYAPDGTTLIETDDDDGSGFGGDGTLESGLASAIAGRAITVGGTHFIKVRAFSASSGIVNPYRLMVVVTLATPQAEVEPNDSQGTANRLAIPPVFGWRAGAIALAGDQDFYSIDLAVGDQLYLAADGDPERDNVGTDVALTLLAPDGFTTVQTIQSSSAGSPGFPPAEGAWYSVPTAGTYYVRVTHATGGTGTYQVLAAVGSPIETVADFDGDRRMDVSVYRGSTGDWFISRSIDAGGQQIGWGAPSLGDIPLPGDYDGDRKADVAVFRNSTGQWFLRFSGGGTTNFTWGAPSLGDKPMPADYDGDGKTDLAVYRNSTGFWFIRNSGGGTQTIGWGAPALGDTPVSADYDGDGKADPAVYRTSTGEWFIRNSGGGTTTFGWGSPGLNDIPVPGDYDGDAKTDGAVYRPSTGEWFIRFSSGGSGSATWGAPSLADIPVPADYDGDGKTDIAVYRGSAGQWFMLNSNGGTTFRNWGAPALGDIPLSMPAALR